MRSPNKILTVLTLFTILTISDFVLIQNPKSKIQNFQVFAQIPDARKMEADLLFRQGNQQFQISQVEEALQFWQQALAIYREIKNRQGEAASLGNLGIAYDSLGDYTKAIVYYQQCLIITQEIEDRFNEGRVLGNLGATYSSLGDYAKAIEYQRQSLAIKREIKDRQGEGQALGNLGTVSRLLADYAKAIEYYQQSLAIFREIKDRQGERQSLDNLGATYNSLGDYAKAIEYGQQSLTISQEIKDRLGEGASLSNLGVAYYSLGDYAKAIEYHQQSLAIVREIKDRLGEGTSLGNLGVAYYSLGDYAKAIEYHQQSLAIKQEIKDLQGEGKTLGDLGNVYQILGDYVKAIDYYQQCLAITRKVKARKHEGQCLGNLGSSYLFLNNYAKAIEYQQQRLAIAQEISDTNGEGTARNNLGLALFISGNLIQAEKILRTGIEIWEFQRARLGNNDNYKVSIFDEQARTYILLQTILIAQNNPKAALEIAERGRARVLVELLSRRNPIISESANSLITPPNIGLLQQIAKQQNATLVEYSIAYDVFKIKSQLYIWVIKPTGEISFRKTDFKPLWQHRNTSLAELVTNSREYIGIRNRSELATIVPEPTAEVQQRRLAQQRQKLQQLHQLLIKPIANLLPTNPQARVIFIPQSELFLVPFPALVDTSGQYLIEKHTILTAPSIQALDLTRQQRQRLRNLKRGTGIEKQTSNPELLIVGNPLMPKVWNSQTGRKEQLSYLKGAEKEAQAIAQFFNAPVLLGEQATERAIKQRISNARIIHLATHGLLDYGIPEDTGVRDFPGAVALAPGDGEDGLLTSAEIIDMNLKAELVVLSACDTGRGRIRSEGVIGLSRSLISAGVPSVIVSLWAVDDAATTDLMQEFYKQWQQNPDKAQALRQAMLITMQKHPDPRLWAAFTLIGEAE
ncbi:tetratricopeptide repeat protein [Floridanema aerugineum]|uniref:Tetratricopeptide repeat protein n=1 Tax=Floridaenema aerugineum BLCC-F46 TaxID=3153654 RepID=A0ABV4X4R7_9CYAN